MKRLWLNQHLSNPPKNGWQIEGEIIHTPHAYMTYSDWIDDFRKTFPKKAKIMDEYSKSKGWLAAESRFNWFEVMLMWLDNKGERI